MAHALEGTDPREEEAAHFGKRELRILWPHLRPHIRLGVYAALLLIVSQAAALAAPRLIQYGIDQGIRARDPDRLTLAVAILAGTAAVTWVCLRAAMSFGGAFGERALRSIRVNVFDHLSHLDLGFFEREKTGRLVARLTSDVETIEVLVTEGLVSMSAQFMYLLGSIIVLVTIDPVLAAASLAATLPLMVTSTVAFRARSERAYRRVRERIANVLTFMQETVRGVHVVQAFGRERFNSRRFRRVNEDWREANIDSFRPGAVFFPLIEFIGVLGQGVVLGYGGWRAAHGDLTEGVLAAFVLFLSATLDPIQQLSQLYDVFQQAMAGLGKLAGLLEARATVTEAQDPLRVGALDGSAALDDVTFRYRENLPAALSDVEIDIEPGEVLALVGPTGAGKSTIAKLLLRFYDPTSGRVSIDSHDLRKLSLDDLRSNASMVPQEGFLFRGTIRDNIRFGRPDASDAEVEQICHALGIDEAVRRMPNGYDTEVRERGAALSGGERQLIALARALLVDPRLIVLDEATSALDAATEANVEHALRTLSEGRTTIVIAHRLSTASRANRVAVVDRGRIIELGTHDELVNRPDGLYARLYEHWLAN
ncbi:MAG: ABC transporter ATP-binding protein [Candidatus Binatia bacterium]